MEISGERPIAKLIKRSGDLIGILAMNPNQGGPRRPDLLSYRSIPVDKRTRSAHAWQNAFSFKSINSTECEADIAQR